MKIEREDLNILAELNWDDWEKLKSGKIVGNRYDGQNKLLIQTLSEANRHNLNLGFSPQGDYAEFNRYSMDIDVYVSPEDLKDVRISASVFNVPKDNLEIIPYVPFCEDMCIKIIYPGSLKKIDIPTFFE